MREVRACDFCDAGADGVFEVLPAEVTGGEPRRMVLCGDCHGTLEGVVAPLFDALETGIGSRTGGDTPGSEGGGGTESDTGTGGAAGGTGVDPEADGDGEDVHESGGRTLRNRGGTPKGYSKVMRFLEGREFPMPREEAESMVVEAYGMDGSAVAAAIDHATKHDRLREASGKLFR
jgi:hypothetical protein